uniref:Uncharacterized protein n=1 Tax=Panagrolaimus sp. JU765 TaxID=591449 RepID=A0AC34RHA5_9BILA
NDAPPIPFTVVTSSSPKTPIFSSELTGEIRFTLENIDKNDWVRFNFEGDLRVCYDVLADGFPRNEYKNSQERIEKINEVLGTKIAIINLEMLNEMIQAPC